MTEHQEEKAAALAALNLFVGKWTIEAHLGDGLTGEVSFAWTLDGQYLLERSTAPALVPDSLALIAPSDVAHTYRRHYFDSRGVTRLYQMSLRDGIWTLCGAEADFSPLDFWPRFEGTFSADNNRIDARWEQSHDQGATWALNFRLTYTRIR